MIRFVTAAHFAWIAASCNTIRELVATFDAPKAIARDMQKAIANGASAYDCNAIATASYVLCNQVGA